MQLTSWTPVFEENTTAAEPVSVNDVEREKRLWARTKANRLYTMGELAKAAQLLMESQAA
jgi:hypothetical protein